MSRKIDHKIGSFFRARSDSNPGDKKVREEVLMLIRRSTDGFNSNRAYFAKVLDC